MLTVSPKNSFAQAPSITNISQEEFLKIKQSQKAIIIDVRTKEEIAEGFIKDASVFADVNAADFAQQIAKLDTSKTYIVYCRSGARSTTAANYMLSKGFSRVYNLKGGISNWKGEIIRK